MYQLSGVVKQYKTKRGTINALDGLNLTVNERDLLVIQGPTGGGKSTLLQMLGGLDRPTTGDVRFDGHDFGKISETDLTKVRATSIGFVFQFFNLIPTLNAQENVEAALVPLGVDPATRRDRARQALESVGLGDRLHHLPTELSGGQQQRTAIARALVKEPKVILADEPTGNLDEDTRDEIIGLFEGLWKDRGLTLVMVTHDSAIARWAPRVARIKAGRLTMKKESSVDV